MSDYNQFTVLGAIVSEPELKHTKNGKAFARFRFGYTRGYGDNKQKCYVTVLCWGKLGESIMEWGEKGKKYFLVGDLSVVDSQGDKGWSTSVFVNANTVKSLSNGEKKEPKQAGGDPLEEAYVDGSDEDQDEIPF
jgi:single-stranded DNA-binding protein